MKKAMIRQKEGIVKPQVVAGREFKGTAFISKPEKIIFKVSHLPLSYCVSSVGFHSGPESHVDYSVHECLLLVQLVQTSAPRRQDKGFLPHPVHAVWTHECRSLHHHHHYLHTPAQPRHQHRVPHSQWNWQNRHSPYLHLQESTHWGRRRVNQLWWRDLRRAKHPVLEDQEHWSVTN